MKYLLPFFLAALMSQRAIGADEGFLATYYGDTLVGAAQGKPIASGLDAVIDFDFIHAPRAGMGRATDFSARWKGTVTPRYSETYTFFTYSDDGVRVWIDDRLVIDNWTDHAPTWNWQSVALQAGRPSTVRVEYYQRGGQAEMHFYWSSASQAAEAVHATPAGATLAPVLDYNRPGRTSNGDTFYTAWAADGTHFMMADDTTGFNGDLAGTAPGNTQFGRNVAVDLLSGRPDDPDFRATAWFGNTQALAFLKGNNEAGPGLPQGGIWKGSGLGIIDGVLYLTVNDQTRDATGKVVATGASLLKSTDMGMNWQGPAAAGYPWNAAPLPLAFQDRRFSRINFVQYGQDGQSPDAADDSVNYVYATSNGGEWENGSDLYLGRVLRSRLAWNMASDWEFYGGTVDGTPRWGPLSASQPVFSKAGKVSQTQMTYLPALHKYILPNWYYVRPGTLQPGSPDYYGAASTPHTRWEFFLADTPWGPWKPSEPFFVKEWFTEGYYNPSIPNKFIDGKTLWLLFAGNYWDANLYSLHAARLTLD